MAAITICSDFGVFLRKTSTRLSPELWVVILPPKPLTGCIDDHWGDLWAEHTLLICKQYAEAVVVQTPDPTDWLWSQSVAQSCLTLCDPMDCSTPGLPVLHYLPEFARTHVHHFGDAIQPSHPLLPPSPPALGLCQRQGLFQWVSSSHQVAKVEFQLQHQSFQWTPRTDL